MKRKDPIPTLQSVTADWLREVEQMHKWKVTVKITEKNQHEWRFSTKKDCHAFVMRCIQRQLALPYKKGWRNFVYRIEKL